MADAGIETPPRWVSVAGPLREHDYELEKGDGERVERGMEMLAFDYPYDAWREWLENRRIAVSRATRRAESMAVLPVAGVVGVVLSVATGIAAISVAATGGVLFGGAIAGSALVARAIRSAGRSRYLDSQRSTIPSLRISSTGVRLAGLARLWKGQRYALRDVKVRGTDPLCLVFRFTGQGLLRRPEELWVPLPEDLEVDAWQIRELLRERMQTHDAELSTLPGDD